MATYDYDVVGFPASPVTGDYLTIGAVTYIYTTKGTWDVDSPLTTSRVVGPQGIQGIQGIQGVVGPSGGDSAYTIAVSNGFVGTESEWLDSLDGAQGIQGIQGEVGPQGTNTISTSDPLTTSNPGSVGHLWVNSISGETFVCTDVTTNANIWVNGNTDNDTVYTHPTGDGNLHVPATSTSNDGKVLTAGSTAGALSWETVSGSGSGAMGGTMTSHIIPDTNDVYDIGSAEKKIRDLFVSENSLWIGDDHKVSIEGGKQKNKKRKKGKTPKKVFDALIGSGKPFATEADLKVKFKTDIYVPAPSNRVDPDHADFQPLIHQWLHFALTNGMAGAITPENIFDNDDFDDDDINRLTDLSDVDLITTVPTADQVLKYDGTNWIPSGSDLSKWAEDSSGHLIPDTDNAYDIGSSTKKIRDIFLSGSTINLGDKSISADADGIKMPAIKIGTGATAQIISADADGIKMPAIQIGTGSDVVKLTASAGGSLVQTSTVGGVTQASVAYDTSDEVDVKIANLVDSAPGTLNTLNELAAALGDNASYATSTATLIGTKADKSTTYTKTEVDAAIPNSFAPVGAEVNVQADWDVTDTSLDTYVANKPVIGVVFSDTPPASPTAGDLWVDSSIMQLNTYYTDTDSSQWVGTSAVTASGSGAMGGTMTSHIIPDTNDVYDIGSAEKKIRDLFVSENSLWIGDSHKITTSGGKKKTKKRKKGKTPKKVFDAMVGVGKIFDDETSLKAKFKIDIHNPAPDPVLDPDVPTFDPPIHKWLEFSAINGQPDFKRPEHIFDDDDDFENEEKWTEDDNGHLIPETDNTYDIGSSSKKVRDLYLSGSTIHLGDKSISSDADGISMPAIKIGTGATAQVISADADGIKMPAIQIGTGSDVVKLTASAGGSLVQTSTVGGVTQPSVAYDTSDEVDDKIANKIHPIAAAIIFGG